MTLLPKNEDDISAKDFFEWVFILVAICIIIYLHSWVNKIIVNRRAKSGKEEDGVAGKAVEVAETVAL